MATRELKTEQDAMDFVRGCAFFGTGGGGAPERGLSLLLDALKKGKRIQWLDLSEVDDNAWVTSPGYIGSIAPLTEERRRLIDSLALKEKKHDRLLEVAISELESFLQYKVDAFVPVELGGINTPVPLATAAEMGKVCVDGDYAGRAVPIVDQLLPALADKNVTPMCCCDSWGNVTVFKKVVNQRVADWIARVVTEIAPEYCGCTFFTMKAREMKHCIVPGTLTECYEVGKAIREAREKGDDPVKAAIDAVSGWLLFKGRVQKKDWAEKSGHMVGTAYIDGIQEFEGQRFSVWLQNENHVAWKNDEVLATSPDLIEIVELATCEPIMNTYLEAGQAVAVVGVKAREQYRTQQGIDVLGPRHFGFDMEYIPIEKNMQEGHPER